MEIGLLVNPIAGLGGAVGLNGTDGPDIVAEALRRGAVAHAGERTRQAIALLAARIPGVSITCAPGDMGANWLKGLNLKPTILDLPARTGTSLDTRAAVMGMGRLELIVFAGGDGTARDVARCLQPRTALLGIPCGVKMHSGVFAITPKAAGALLSDILGSPDRIRWNDKAEIMDIDEAALRLGHLAPKLFGHVRTPISYGRVQASKGGARKDWSLALKGAAEEIAENMDPHTLYVIGPGTSAGAVASALGIEPTILGIDVIRGGQILIRNATAAQLEARTGKVRLVLGVTGQQGFLLGRGNQQISPAIIQRAGLEGLIVLASKDKLSALSQPRLWIDTGDPALDDRLSGFIRVKTARRREMVMRIGAG